jgi:galactokinase
VITAFAPGRVNLIGDHTDYSGGLVFPMAIDRGTTVVLDPGGTILELRSDLFADDAVVPIEIADPSTVSPPWARYVAGVVAAVRPAVGGRGEVMTTLPIGAGLSSSAALELAVALAIGAPADEPLALAQLCQGAEQRASGVPCGIMDQLAGAAGVADCALLLDCTTLQWDAVAIPAGVEVVVVQSGETRALATSAYAERRASVEEAARLLGRPLRDASLADLDAIDDAVLRHRARHVITENERVRAFAAALAAGDLPSAGALMLASHASLRDDFEVSTPALDALVARLAATGGVWGARLTGAGFGGCAVALAEPGAVGAGWVVRPSAGAWVKPS